MAVGRMKEEKGKGHVFGDEDDDETIEGLLFGRRKWKEMTLQGLETAAFHIGRKRMLHSSFLRVYECVAPTFPDVADEKCRKHFHRMATEKEPMLSLFLRDGLAYTQQLLKGCRGQVRKGRRA